MGDAEGIHAIYAPVVENSVTSFEYAVPSVAEMARRIGEGLQRYPWLVATDASDEVVLGYAYACSWRARTAYRWTCEVSVYVHPDHRRRGLARILYTELLLRLQDLGYVLAIAGITLPNPASQAFHEDFGFEPVGIFPGCGHKFGDWLDVGFWRIEMNPRGPSPEPPAAP